MGAGGSARTGPEETMRVSTIHDLPDDVLRRILLRLDCPLWLVRAACACKRWRRAVTDGGDEGRAFLRLASSLHPPTVVGKYHERTRGDFRFVPSSSPTPIDGSRFSLDDFLELDKLFPPWQIADCHGGLVLLCTSYGPCAGSVVDIIVYDPLTRKHRSISDPRTRSEALGYGIREVFLLDGDDGHISISNFKVLHRQLNGGDTAAATSVFSRSNGGEWCWRRFQISHRSSEGSLYPGRSHVAGRVDGSLYLGLYQGSRIMAIDSTSLVFSMVDLPTRVDMDTSLFRSSSFTVVHGVVGGLGPTSAQRTTSIVHVCGEVLELFRRVQGSGEWVLEHTIANLSEATRGLSVRLDLWKKEGIKWSTMVGVMADDGAAFGILSGSNFSLRWFLSIDVNTMELQVLPEETYHRDTTMIFNYTLPWPQFLRACP